ncbi:MAG TPA: hypothetical protein VN203_06640, partial [Candidatus Acidoferrum sp.]|nr:hypothetical protein [Candidatus Acidoferrum sp.]
IRKGYLVLPAMAIKWYQVNIQTAQGRHHRGCPPGQLKDTLAPNEPMVPAGCQLWLWEGKET